MDKNQKLLIQLKGKVQTIDPNAKIILFGSRVCGNYSDPRLIYNEKEYMFYAIYRANQSVKNIAAF